MVVVVVVVAVGGVVVAVGLGLGVGVAVAVAVVVGFMKLIRKRTESLYLFSQTNYFVSFFTRRHT